MTTREQFYKSKKWEAFRKVIINERTDADGFVHCSECGKCSRTTAGRAGRGGRVTSKQTANDFIS